MILARDKSVFPTCQSPKLITKNSAPARIKNGVETSSSFAQSVADFRMSIELF
jgi:hypothetical protein